MANFPQIDATTYASLVAANPNFKAILWSQGVIKGVQQRSLFKNLIGSEKSRLPVIRKNDLSKGTGQQVVFTTLAPVRGLGVLGEGVLTGNERKVGFSDFSVTVDLLRHASSYTQVIDLVRKLGKPLSVITAELETDWWGRREDDDIQTVLRNRALLVSPATNLFRVNNRTSRATLLSSDTVTTSTIEATKAALGSIGGMAIEVDGQGGGMADENEKYLLVAPANFLRPLRGTASFQSALQQAGVRGAQNELFLGRYPLWDGNIINRHVVKEDAADGRQGSPLEPFARLGTALADATPTTITGGGTTYPAGTGDYFAYFPGFPWKITDNEVLPTDEDTYYAMIYNLTGADAGKYEIFSYTQAGMATTGASIGSVTRGTTSNFAGNAAANAASRFTAAHPSGSLILPCTVNGVILGWGLHMGAQALYHATGSKNAEPIANGQDYKNSGDEWHLVGQGIQGIRGMSVYTDKRSVAPNFLLIEGARVHPGVNPVAYLG